MIIQGNSLNVLKGLDTGSVNCIITSPPYWSLRKYDIPDVDFGDWVGQLGLEPTIELYLKHLLEIFDECKRVLRDDGTCWVNLGDSYGYSGREGSQSQYQDVVKGKYSPQGGKTDPTMQSQHFKPFKADIKLDKSLCLIPECFAIEMVNRGWILRNKLIWHKPNCMPSSAKDRFTVDFEPIFFFVKSRKYWFEQQYEPSWSEGSIHRHKNDGKMTVIAKTINPTYPQKDYITPSNRNRRCVWTISTQPYPESHFATFPEALVEPMIRAGCPKGGTILDPFCGSGTALMVAERLGRKAIGIDLGYEELAEKRLRNNQMVLM